MESKSKYTVDYFIDKFSKIPTEEIGRGSLNNHCALYHCGVRDYGHLTDEAIALGEHIRRYENEPPYKAVYYLNDGIGGDRTYGYTPKERILNRLKEIKEK